MWINLDKSLIANSHYRVWELGELTPSEAIFAYLALSEDKGSSAVEAGQQGKGYKLLTPEQRLAMAEEIGPPPDNGRQRAEEFARLQKLKELAVSGNGKSDKQQSR